MNQTSDIELMAERLESLKAGIIAAVSLLLAFVITTLINNLVFAKYFTNLSSLQVNIANWQWLVRGAIAAICGLLFGVTYRYIIRDDSNFQLQAGAVLAFGLVRGLSLLDMRLNQASSILPTAVLAVESILWFALAASAVNWAIRLGWVKPFK